MAAHQAPAAGGVTDRIIYKLLYIIINFSQVRKLIGEQSDDEIIINYGSTCALHTYYVSARRRCRKVWLTRIIIITRVEPVA
jgi:PHP family Zn ribbon phosphoesterase